MGREADGGQHVSDAMAHTGAVDDDGALSVEFAGPSADASGIAPRGTGNKAGRCREHVGSADVEHERWDGSRSRSISCKTGMEAAMPILGCIRVC